MYESDHQMAIAVWPKFGAVLQDSNGIIRLRSKLINDDVLKEIRDKSFPEFCPPSFLKEYVIRTPITVAAGLWFFLSPEERPHSIPQILARETQAIIFKMSKIPKMQLNFVNVICNNAVTVRLELKPLDALKDELDATVDILNIYLKLSTNGLLPECFVDFAVFHNLLRVQKGFHPSPDIQKELKKFCNNKQPYQFSVGRFAFGRDLVTPPEKILVQWGDDKFVLNAPLLEVLLKSQGIEKKFLEEATKAVISGY